MAPSTTIGAVSPSARRAATNVVVFQCPWGTGMTSRAPTGARPYRRVMFVLAHVSSMNTSRAGSRAAIASAHSSRFAFTSGRSCSAARRTFFERQPEPVEARGQGAQADPDPEPVPQLGQGGVGFGGHQVPQPGLVGGQLPRPAGARRAGADPAGLP